MPDVCGPSARIRRRSHGEKMSLPALVWIDKSILGNEIPELESLPIFESSKLSILDSRSVMANETRNLEGIPIANDLRPTRDLPVLPVRDTVLFPHAVLPLTVGRESSVQLINSLGEDKTIVVVAQREARVDSPQPSD